VCCVLELDTFRIVSISSLNGFPLLLNQGQDRQGDVLHPGQSEDSSGPDHSAGGPHLTDGGRPSSCVHFNPSLVISPFYKEIPEYGLKDVWLFTQNQKSFFLHASISCDTIYKALTGKLPLYLSSLLTHINTNHQTRSCLLRV